MQSFFAVKNDTAFPVISVGIDGKRTFYDILKGETSAFIPLLCGSVALCVYDNFEKKIFDVWLSVPPFRRLVLSVSESGLYFI